LEFDYDPLFNHDRQLRTIANMSSGPMILGMYRSMISAVAANLETPFYRSREASISFELGARVTAIASNCKAYNCREDCFNGLVHPARLELAAF
jgi:hypothetical protein